MNLTNKMNELITSLRTKGFLGLKFPEIRRSCLECWSEDYAIVEACYPDTFALEMEYEGFDLDDYAGTFEAYLHEFFGPGIRVNYRRGCQEIEVYPEVTTPVVVEPPVVVPALRPNEKRIVLHSELAKNDSYGDLAILARMFNHDVVEMLDGQYRWRLNQLMRWITDPDNPIKIDLNLLQRDVQNGHGTVLEYMKYAMQTGCSLCYFTEIFGRASSEWSLPDGLDGESPINYARRLATTHNLRI